MTASELHLIAYNIPEAWLLLPRPSGWDNLVVGPNFSSPRC